MTKFKVGDLVRIKSYEDFWGGYKVGVIGVVGEPVPNTPSKSLVIEAVDTLGKPYYRDYMFHKEHQLELLSPVSQEELL